MLLRREAVADVCPAHDHDDDDTPTHDTTRLPHQIPAEKLDRDFPKAAPVQALLGEDDEGDDLVCRNPALATQVAPSRGFLVTRRPSRDGGTSCHECRGIPAIPACRCCAGPSSSSSWTSRRGIIYRRYLSAPHPAGIPVVHPWGSCLPPNS